MHQQCVRVSQILYARRLRHIFTGWNESLLGAAALDGLDDLFDDGGVGELV